MNSWLIPCKVLQYRNHPQDNLLSLAYFFLLCEVVLMGTLIAICRSEVLFMGTDSVQIKNRDDPTQPLLRHSCKFAQSEKHHILPFQSARPLQTQQKHRCI